MPPPTDPSPLIAISVALALLFGLHWWLHRLGRRADAALLRCRVATVATSVTGVEQRWRTPCPTRARLGLLDAAQRGLPSVLYRDGGVWVVASGAALTVAPSASGGGASGGGAFGASGASGGGAVVYYAAAARPRMTPAAHLAPTLASLGAMAPREAPLSPAEAAAWEALPHGSTVDVAHLSGAVQRFVRRADAFREAATAPTAPSAPRVYVVGGSALDPSYYVVPVAADAPPPTAPSAAVGVYDAAAVRTVYRLRPSAGGA